MQTRKKRLIIERAKLKKWTLLLLLALLIASLGAEVIQINNDWVKMTTENLRTFVQDSEELRILKENGVGKQSAVTQNYRIYLGGNMGTYGAGVNAGVIW